VHGDDAAQPDRGVREEDDLLVAAFGDERSDVGQGLSVRSPAMTAAAGAGARLSTWRGEPAVTVGTGALRATFLPACSMLGVGLEHAGDELLAPIAPLDRYRQGHVTGMPLLYPWANRLGRWSYDALGRHVDVSRDAPVDDNGIPIHGTVTGLPFEVTHLDANRVTAQLDASTPRIAESFPFPHVAVIDAVVTGDTMQVTTTIDATGSGSDVPVSFGFHPYFRLPGAPRARWKLRMPARDHVELDERQLPTGKRVPEPEEDRAIARRTFDDCYALTTDDRRFVVSTPTLQLTLTFDDAYPYAQVYAPPRSRFVCIEPMTAPVNALVDGTFPTVARGTSLSATWRAAVARL
jgi:galactose mutarotase-like enzyme